MLKAHVKINISIHLEDESVQVDPAASAMLNLVIKYPLQVHHAGTIAVEDKAEAERVIAMLTNHVDMTFRQMGVVPCVTGHTPDLALAFGGDPEPIQ